jgi:hypothetical protein
MNAMEVEMNVRVICCPDTNDWKWAFRTVGEIRQSAVEVELVSNVIHSPSELLQHLAGKHAMIVSEERMATLSNSLNLIATFKCSERCWDFPIGIWRNSTQKSKTQTNHYPLGYPTTAISSKAELELWLQDLVNGFDSRRSRQLVLVRMASIKDVL